MSPLPHSPYARPLYARVMERVQVRTFDGEPVRLWWGFPSQPVRVLHRYTLPARSCIYPSYGKVNIRWQRECWHVQLGDASRATLCYEPATGRWLAGRRIEL